MSLEVFKIDRRSALRIGALSGAGLVIGCDWFKKPPPKRIEGDAHELNAYVLVASDDTVTVVVPESEMGQGILTAAAMIVAEELDADWKKVRAVHAPARIKDYGWQGTGASTSIRDGFSKLRVMGATARDMLLGAAAKSWSVPKDELTAADGIVIHEKTKQKLSFGQLARAASEELAPREPPLKDWRKFKLIGKPLVRLDLEDKVTGRAVFGIDVKRPGMLIAQVARSPVLGGRVKKFDGAKALAVPGVRQVFAIPTGVVVLGDHFWAAKKGREALSIEWEGGAEKLSNATIRESLIAVIDRGKDAAKVGDADGVLAKAAKKIDAEYELPFLAHMPMEPMCCTAEVKNDRCDVWVGTQAVSQTQQVAQEITGLDASDVFVHTMFLGGGFGRRSKVDFVSDAVHAAKTAGVPVKVVWTREDDVRGGWYRPAAIARMSGAIDESGNVVAWRHLIAGYPILGLKEGLDPFSLEGASNLPYIVPHLRVSYACPLEQQVATWFWRSVGASQNAFVVECFIDELAHLAGLDPMEMRNRLLGDSPRHKRVMHVAADKAGWGGKIAEGHALGLAVHQSFGSYVAQVADVSMESDGRVRVHRVVCAIDCGEVINPDTVAAQMEGSIVFGLSAAFFGGVSVRDGRVVEGNFHDYPLLRFPETPKIEVHIVTGGPPIGGVGEPGVPPIAPAVANAMFKLTGKRVRALPMMRNIG